MFSKEFKWAMSGIILTVVVLSSSVMEADAHIIPPENFHPAAEGYRRMMFMLNLNPVLWDQVEKDAGMITNELRKIDPDQAGAYQSAVEDAIMKLKSMEESGPDDRKAAARSVYEHSTRAIARAITMSLNAAEKELGNGLVASGHLTDARRIWASFDYEIQYVDNGAHRRLGRSWLELTSSLGTSGVLGIGEIAPQKSRFQTAANEIRKYLAENFGESFQAGEMKTLAPLPLASATYNKNAKIPIKLPPGSNINKQVPRPRQILNMASRGVAEDETPLIALGDMVFDSSRPFRGPMRELQMSCNNCHNKGVTNPDFFIPGLSHKPGSVDITSSYLAPHANNGHFDAKDIPDLRGIRFTGPYGRDGRTASLREFIRNGIMHEFNGPEPDPLLVDATLAYMNEFDFLPNPKLNKDGTLSSEASEAARRGEKIFNKPFAQMNDKSCATCHIPGDHFIDRQRHDIGTVRGSDPGSLDRALETPTLLSAKFTQPYFHDGSQPTLRSVVEWFNRNFALSLPEHDISDLTAYLEDVGDGIDSYEDSIYYLDAEMEEFSFFLSTYEYLKEKDKPAIMTMTFQTIADEIRNHKWELRELKYIPVMDRLAEIMDEAVMANEKGQRQLVDAKVDEYRALYASNVDNLK